MKNLAIANQNSRAAFGTRTLALSGILIGIGFVLHAIVPPIFFGIKPDFMLACMFVAILINPNIKNAVVVGVVAGIVAAMTTGFPGGQLPSLVDKLLSAVAVYALVSMIPAKASKAAVLVIFTVISFVGTVISGLVFLGSALVIAGLPAPMMSLVLGIVLPTAVANAGVGALMYKVQSSLK